MILIDMTFSFEVCQNERNIDADCFACVVSTHGSEEIEKRKGEGSAKQVYQHCVYGSDGLPVFINDMLEEIQDDTSPYLAGKPKLFFIQVMFLKPYLGVKVFRISPEFRILSLTFHRKDSKW